VISGIAVALGLAAVSVGQAQPRPSSPQAERPVRIKPDHPGRQVFEQQCAPCHGAGPGDDGAAMLPGTMTLAAKYRGQLPGALELRSDLTAETLRYFVRNGSGAMPMFRKAELSDAQIDAIAGYLAATAAANALKPGGTSR